MESAPKSILHLDLDTFFVSVERLQNKALNNKPVLIGGTSGRSVVANYMGHENLAFVRPCP